MESGGNAELSAVLVAGARRARAQRVIDALSVQTALEDIELILVDLAHPMQGR